MKNKPTLIIPEGIPHLPLSMTKQVHAIAIQKQRSQYSQKLHKNYKKIKKDDAPAYVSEVLPLFLMLDI